MLEHDRVFRERVDHRCGRLVVAVEPDVVRAKAVDGNEDDGRAIRGGKRLDDRIAPHRPSAVVLEDELDLFTFPRREIDRRLVPPFMRFVRGELFREDVRRPVDRDAETGGTARGEREAQPISRRHCDGEGHP